MNTLSFISDLVKSLIWPLSLLVILLLFRRQILILFDTISSIKAKDYEVSFSKEIKEKLEIDNDKNKENKLNNILKPLLQDRPDLALFEAWRLVEIKASEKASELGINELNRGDKFLRQIEYDRLIPTSDVLSELKSLRNLVAHGEVKEIKQKFAFEYIEYCEKIINEIGLISMLPKMKLHNLTYIIIELNSMIDSNKYKVDINEIELHIEKKDVLQYIQSISNNEVDFSLVFEPNDKIFLDKYYSELLEIMGGYKGDEFKKWGVKNSGICLLLAWTNEIIQRGRDWKESIT